MNENEKIIQMIPYAYEGYTSLFLTSEGRIFALTYKLCGDANTAALKRIWQEIDLPNFNE